MAEQKFKVGDKVLINLEIGSKIGTISHCEPYYDSYVYKGLLAGGIPFEADECSLSKAPSNTVMTNSYYTNKNGIQLQEFTREMDFNCGNVMRYAWRNGKKKEEILADDRTVAIKDLNKAMDYLYDEIVNVLGGECKYKLVLA